MGDSSVRAPVAWATTTTASVALVSVALVSVALVVGTRAVGAAADTGGAQRASEGAAEAPPASASLPINRTPNEANKKGGRAPHTFSGEIDTRESLAPVPAPVPGSSSDGVSPSDLTATVVSVVSASADERFLLPFLLSALAPLAPLVGMVGMSVMSLSF